QHLGPDRGGDGRIAVDPSPLARRERTGTRGLMRTALMKPERKTHRRNGAGVTGTDRAEVGGARGSAAASWSPGFSRSRIRSEDSYFACRATLLRRSATAERAPRQPSRLMT